MKKWQNLRATEVNWKFFWLIEDLLGIEDRVGGLLLDVIYLVIDFTVTAFSPTTYLN